jgi:hypothetical protein
MSKTTVYDLYQIRKGRKIASHPDKHIPNKNESQALRKIMAENHLTEDEVRANIKYRRILAKAQKEGEKRKRSESKKWYQDQIKAACKKTGLVPQHPETIKVLAELLEGANPRWLRLTRGSVNIPSAENVVKHYANK